MEAIRLSNPPIELPNQFGDGNHFRTAPLWGVSARIFFLHDGRTKDLMQAIQDHQSNRSEANAVISAFTQQTVPNQQALLDFLRSL